MIHLDANVVLRYLLDDDAVLFQRAVSVIDGPDDLFIANEVLAEIVYVLQKVYGVERRVVSSRLSSLLARKTVHVPRKKTALEALGLYAARNVDIVDALLVAKHRVEGARVFSFDDRVNRLLNER